ncbi:type I restriction endonuclease [Maridesulfovibrio sp.]|uniref:type I restriction endonuclease subunit R n=1 Tax=Maridesulfovibrio sp. TaxID=2795000 RepID=UPI002AA8DDC3|nr:type I restriction endonuclease [Maridesulfovibrio sp.]
MADAREKQFQQDIIDSLAANGWIVGKAENYDREHALYNEDVVGFMREAHPDQWDKFCKMFPKDTEAALIRSVVRRLDKKGSLDVLRHGYKDRGARIRLCRFKPDHGLNAETLRQYGCNRLRVVPEVTYSPHGYGGRLDLVLFVNGIPVATLELKSEFKQPVAAAIRQYKYDRPPVDPATRRAEPLLSFGKRALVHFAVSQEEAWMCTRLAGKDSFFLPFNMGSTDGGKGNPLNPDGYDTSYLWERVMLPDNWLHILGRFLHLQQEEKEDWEGRKYIKETLIFPRYHQWDVVNRLIKAAGYEGAGNKYLVQHSAGSGKSNSIAWTAHQLASLYDGEGGKVFDSVIVVTDRTVLDAQLQDTIYQFEHASGLVSRISRELGDGSKSEQLANALESATRIIIVTIQTFPYVLELLRERTSLKGNNYAIIADEAHSSQTGSTARKLREVLGVKQREEGDELSTEDLLDAAVESRKASENISYFAFTATPKSKTLETFGRTPDPDLPPSKDNIPQPFHVYSMRQAIEEGFILDVLKNYTTYNMACRLGLKDGAIAEEVDARKGASTIARWVRLHPYNISQKVEVIIEHFRSRVASMLNGQAKAMVVTDSRKAAVRYKLAFDKYIAANREDCEGIQAMVAFSGEVVDEENGVDSFNEKNMNSDLRGRDMRKAFDTAEYQVMIVANKFQTGFDQPKLCAMYVDKKLSGVDAVQTLSRLNRIFPGKDQTFVLDFVNKPEEILLAFKPFYQTAELADVSDPNLASDLKEKLDSQMIYLDSEVDAFVRAFFDEKVGQYVLMSHCRPALERYRMRYRESMEVLRRADKELCEAKATGHTVMIKNAEHSLKQAHIAKDVLDVFKKDLLSFIRFYEFSSQILDYADRDLESFNIYARHLQPLLREQHLDEDVDLSDVIMTHYRLSKQREETIKLQPGENIKIRPTSAVGSRVPRAPKTESLEEIIARMNELFGGDFTDSDGLSYLRTIVDKLRENERVMAQLDNNTPEWAMKGDFPVAVEEAVIDSMETHRDMAMQFLSDEHIQKGLARLILGVLTEEYRGI